MKKTKEQFFIPFFALILFGASYFAYAEVFPLVATVPEIRLDKNLLSLEDPLIIKINGSTVQHKIESSFTLSPEVIGKLTWRNNDLVFTPTQPWLPEQNYHVSFTGLTKTASDFNFNDNFKTQQYPSLKTTTPQEGDVIDPRSPLEFRFNEEPGNFRYEFKIAPSFKYNLSINPEKKIFQLIPEVPLAQNSQYQVIAYASYKDKNDQMWYPKEMANFKFKTNSPPIIEKILPATNEESVKNFTPVKISFNKPIKAENVENFIEITPKTNAKFQLETDSKILVFKPNSWVPKTKYTIKVKAGLNAQDGTFLDKDFTSNFISFTETGIIQNTASTETAKIKEGRYVDVNLSKQLLSIFSDGTNVGNYRVSSGKKGMNTPTGTFHILSKRRRAWSNEYKLFMPYWMQFTREGHGIHELPEWPSGYKEGANHLGIPVSHGCVRLGVGPAQTVYNFVDVGTPVYIHY